MSTFNHIRQSHRITLDAPIDQCFRFFTPAGEELWAPGWQPTYLQPADGTTRRDMAFTTGQGDEFTLWLLLDFDPARHYARYARVTPASRAGTVEVQCEALGPAATAVTVTYALTATTEAGNAALAAFEPDAYRAMIDGWQQLVTERLPTLLSARIR